MISRISLVRLSRTRTADAEIADFVDSGRRVDVQEGEQQRRQRVGPLSRNMPKESPSVKKTPPESKPEPEFGMALNK